MYKILILYNADHNLWQQYGTTTTSSVSGNKSSFTEFATDDIEVLKAEILKIDRQYGFERIKVYKDISANYSVDIIHDEGADMEVATDEEVSLMISDIFGIKNNNRKKDKK